MRIFRTTMILIAMVILVSCAMVILVGCQQTKDMALMQAGLVKRYPGTSFAVNILNGTGLHIILINAPAGSQPPDQKRAYALGVAQFVRDNYPRYDGIRLIKVHFSSGKSIGPLNLSSTYGYRFTSSELGPRVASPSGSGGTAPAL
jgi:hypothetical protein